MRDSQTRSVKRKNRRGEKERPPKKRCRTDPRKSDSQAVSETESSTPKTTARQVENRDNQNVGESSRRARQCLPRREQPQNPVIDLTGLDDDDDEEVLLVFEKRPPPEVVQITDLPETLPKKLPGSRDAEKEKVYVEGLTCAICLEMSATPACTPCGHIFCSSCLDKSMAFQKKCPQCRRNCTKRQIRRLFC